MLTDSIRIDFIHLLFMMREGIRVNDTVVTLAYGETKMLLLKLCFDGNEALWTYPDVDKALKLDGSRMKNGQKGGRPEKTEPVAEPVIKIERIEADVDFTTKSKPKSSPSPKEKKKSEPNLEYTKLTKMYFDWYADMFGVKPRFDASDGVAMKAIQKWLESNITEENQTVEEGFGFILNNWSKLDTWTQAKTRVRDINSNLNTIISQIKVNKHERLTEGQQDYLASRSDI